MIAVIIIGIIVLIIYTNSSKKKKYQENRVYTNDNQNKKKEQKSREIVQNDNENITVAVTTSSSLDNKIDDSIIDVTSQSYNIKPEIKLKTYNKDSLNGVPYWSHQYVYSFSEINSCSKEQKEFYTTFKNSFLQGEYFDLAGNNNYAFILLFDLLNEYEKHLDITILESELKILGQCYPKTKSYAVSFLIKKMEARGNSDGVLRLKEEDRYTYQNNYTDYDWQLGSKYKTRLNLTEDEVKLLNVLWYPSNNFCNIEFCCIEVLKLYLNVIAQLKFKYIEEGSNLEKQFSEVASIIAKKQFKYREGSENYKYCLESTTKDFFSNIFKHCENALREFYGHKRKINTDIYFTTAEAKTEFETKILSKVAELLSILVFKVTLPDEFTDIELYSQNTNRWKIKFEELTTNYNGKPQDFSDSIISLGKLNKKNPSIENIFFEASKFIAKYDKDSALSFYIHYLYHDLKSSTFDNKQLTKTIQKSLFKTNEQLHDFELIVSELIKDKDIDKALKNVPKVYEVKRKKIQLDKASIKEVQKQHSGTVELLNEYLKDDFEDENNKIKSQEISNEEIEIEIIQKNEEVNHSTFVSELSFTPIHTTVLELFVKSNFSVSQSELEAFAKSKGVFKSQLIESINDKCYDFLDDVLIEEEDDYYTINTNYFQRISTK
jgi:hypothetical protein